MTPRKYLFTTWRLAIMFTKRYFRSKTALFFSILFPLILLFIFGGIFGSSNGGGANVAVINQSTTDFAKKFADGLSKITILKIKPAESLDDAKEQMAKGELDSIIVLPAGFGSPNAQGYPSGEVTVLYDQTAASAGQTVTAVINGSLAGVNATITKIAPPLTVVSQSTAHEGLSGFDYAFTGLIGFSLLGIGIFGPINTLPAIKKTGALQRFRTTPLRPLQFIIAYMASSLTAGAVSIAIMFIVAVQVFHFHMRGSMLVFALFALFAAIMIFGFGMAVGGWANDEKQSAPLGNLVSFPMMFLSGVFFPRFLMPEWLQNISALIPLSPAVDGMRKIATEGAGFLQLGPELAIMAAWTVAIYFIAFRVFRWE